MTLGIVVGVLSRVCVLPCVARVNYRDIPCASLDGKFINLDIFQFPIALVMGQPF